MEEKRSIRSMVREWWKDQIEGAESIDVKALSPQGAATLREDPEFRDRFLDESLPALVYEVGLHLLSEQRGFTKEETKTMTSRQVAKAIEIKQLDWAKWTEYDPISGVHMQFLEMTKEQALASAEFREKAGGVHIRAGAFLRLASGKAAPGQKLKDVWTTDQLADLNRRLIIGKPKYSLGPVVMPNLKSLKGD